MPSHATGHVKKVERESGPVLYLKTRVPGRTPEQTTTKLGALHAGRGRPPEGAFTWKTAEDALAVYLDEQKRRVAAGEFDAPTPEEAPVTFKDAATEYLRFVADVEKRDPTTVKDYRSVIEGYLLNDEWMTERGLPPFSSMPLFDVTPDHVDAYKERLIEEGRLSARTIVRHLVVLHGVFKRAKRVWKLAENPASAELVKRPRVDYTGEFDTYSREEIDALVAAAADEQDAALYLTAAFTGLRQGELLALRWKDVDFFGGLLHVRANYTDRTEKIPKGKRVRSVPMIPEVVDALGKLKEREHFTADGDLVFCNVVGEWLDSWALRRRFNVAIDRAELRRIRFHDLRHAFGTAAVQTLDPFKVQSYMGHKHYSTTQRYLHHKPRPADAMRLQEAFAAKSDGRTLEVEAEPVRSPDPDRVGDRSQGAGEQ